MCLRRGLLRYMCGVGQLQGCAGAAAPGRYLVANLSVLRGANTR